MSDAKIDLEACWKGATEYPGMPLPQEALRAFVRLARAARAYWDEVHYAEASLEVEAEMEEVLALFTDSAELK
jgi:hypothetical protein